MGYTTDFTGQIKVDPPLSAKEIEYVNKFSGTRRVNRKEGPYFVEAGGFMGQEHGDSVINYNRPPDGQPGLWCQWVVTECGGFIEWNECEKFYDSEAWMGYLIDHFIGIAPKAATDHAFLSGHTLNGRIEAQGEESSDKWSLIVIDNKVSKQEFVFSTPKVTCPHCEEEFHLEESA